MQAVDLGAVMVNIFFVLIVVVMVIGLLYYVISLARNRFK
jgi:hypothetical protein